MEEVMREIYNSMVNQPIVSLGNIRSSQPTIEYYGFITTTTTSSGVNSLENKWQDPTHLGKFIGGIVSGVLAVVAVIGTIYKCNRKKPVQAPSPPPPFSQADNITDEVNLGALEGIRYLYRTDSAVTLHFD